MKGSDSKKKSKKRERNWDVEDSESEGSQQTGKLPVVQNKAAASTERFYNPENDDIVDSDLDVFEL